STVRAKQTHSTLQTDAAGLHRWNTGNAAANAGRPRQSDEWLVPKAVGSSAVAACRDHSAGAQSADAASVYASDCRWHRHTTPARCRRTAVRSPAPRGTVLCVLALVRPYGLLTSGARPPVSTTLIS